MLGHVARVMLFASASVGCSSAAGDAGSRDAGVGPDLVVGQDLGPKAQSDLGHPGDLGDLGPAIDPIVFEGLSEDRLSGIVEAVEIKKISSDPSGDLYGVCTGVRGYLLYRRGPQDGIVHEDSIFPTVDNTGQVRCQHSTVVQGNLVLAHHGDEIEEGPFLASISTEDYRTRNVYRGDGLVPFEGLASFSDLLYVAGHASGLGVFRVAPSGTIVPVRYVTEGAQNAWAPLVDPDRRALYLADAQGGVAIYDLSQPDLPSFLGRVDTEGTVKDIAVLGELLYAAAGVAGVEVIDISRLDNPVKLRRIDTPGAALGIDVNESHLAVADWTQVQVYSLEDPERPRVLGHQKSYRPDGVPNPSGRVLDLVLDGDALLFAEWGGVEMHRLVLAMPGQGAQDLLVQSRLVLSRTAPFSRSSTGLAIHNLGQRPLFLSASLAPPFLVEPETLRIPPGSRELLSVAFEPQTSAPAIATLMLSSDDPDEPELGVEVSANRPGLSIGDPVPELSFSDLMGETVLLSSFLGRPVLLAYFATF